MLRKVFFFENFIISVIIFRSLKSYKLVFLIGFKNLLAEINACVCIQRNDVENGVSINI